MYMLKTIQYNIFTNNMSILKTLIESKQIENDDRIPIIINNDKEDLCFMKHGPINFYWNNCSEIYDKKGLNSFKSWDDIKYLDFKVTEHMFVYKESSDCINNFLSNTQPKKLLHIVNTHHDNKSLFELDDWETLLRMLNKYNLSTVVIEVVNKFMSKPESYQIGVDECNRINGVVHYFLFAEHDRYTYCNKTYTDNGRLI